MTARREPFAKVEVTQNDCALNTWQLEEITKGLAEAERKEFASENDVQQILKKCARQSV
jgi:predicted transcriptional regulator